MDKLKPILAHKFWFLFGLALILPVVGYFMTTGELAVEIADRWAKLEGVYKAIPTGVDCPNDQWTNKLNAVNEAEKLANIRANNDLWLAQKNRQRWPQDIAGVMKNALYFKQVSAEQGGTDVPYKYIHDYPPEIRRLWEIVDPLDDVKGNLRDSDKRRKIAFNLNDLHQVNPSRWENIAPTFDEIWACQEDIWLQTELLGAVARVNANSQSQMDAFIKQLGKILLFSGTRVVGDSGTAQSTSAPGDGGQFTAMAGFSGKRSETSTASGSVEIALAEEFVVAQEAGGGGGAAKPAFGGGPLAEGGPTGPSPGGGGATKSDLKRYVDDDETRPFKQRGFYIKLVMDHRKVPELLTELMNSPFPVEIVRVHQVWYTDTGAGMTSGSGMAGQAFPGSGGTKGFGAFPAEGGVTATGESTSPLAASPTSGSVKPGTNPTTAQSAMADPNLASVAILGVWTLYRPPAADPNQAAPNATPSDTSAPIEGDVATTTPAEAAKLPVEPTTDPSTDDSDNKPATDRSLPVEETNPVEKTNPIEKTNGAEPPKSKNADDATDESPAKPTTPADDASEKSSSG